MRKVDVYIENIVNIDGLFCILLCMFDFNARDMVRC